MNAVAEAAFAAQIAKARAALGDAAFDATEALGENLPYEQALDETLAWLSR